MPSGRQYNAAEGLVDQHVQQGHGSRFALLQPGRPTVTYRQLQQAANRLANRLVGLRVEAGQRVTLLLPDSQEFVYAFLACLKVGAVAVPINTFCTAEQLEYFLTDSAAVVMLTHGCYRETVQRLSQQTLFRVKVIYLDEDTNENQSPDFENYPTREDDSAFWLYTSGSTGRPKAVVHRHGAVPCCAASFGRDVLQITSPDRCFSTSKLFFAYGLGNGLIMPLTVGASVVLNPERSDTETVRELIRSLKPTLFFSVPTLYNRCVGEGSFDAELMTTVRMCVSAGEYLPPQILTSWLQTTGQPIYDGIGTTEAMHIFCSNRPGQYRPGTSGQPVAGYDLRIVDEKGATVDQGQIGQLLVRGDTLAREYWNRDEATQKAFQGRWLYTGDLYYQDEMGYFVYAGREGDSFKSAGLWVSPVEIEQALLADADVQEAAVIATANGDGLLGPHAFVKPSVDRLPSDGRARFCRELAARVSEKLPRHKIPHRIEVVSDFPRTSTGKVARQILRKIGTKR